MGLILGLLSVAAHAAGLLLDVAVLFVLVRIVCRRWSVQWLTGFDAAGRQLVESLARRASRVWYRVEPAAVLSSTQQLGLTLMILCVCRLLITAVTGR